MIGVIRAENLCNQLILNEFSITSSARSRPIYAGRDRDLTVLGSGAEIVWSRIHRRKLTIGQRRARQTRARHLPIHTVTHVSRDTTPRAGTRPTFLWPCVSPAHGTARPNQAKLLQQSQILQILLALP